MKKITITKTRGIECFFNTWRGLLAANDKKEKEKKSITNIVYYSGKEAVCTDGHRLHIITNPAWIPAGMEAETSYKVLVNTTREIVLQKTNKKNFPRFPDYKIIIPDDKKLTKVGDINLIKDAGATVSKAIYKIITSTKQAVNVNFIKDIVPGYYDIFHIKDEENRPVFFKNEFFQAIIMPLAG